MKSLCLSFLVLAAGTVLAGCGSSSSVSCGDGIFCPADTSCSADGICLVETNSCSEFELNSACLDVDGRTGYCDEASCESAVSLVGTIGDQLGGGLNNGLEGAEVSVIDQPWVKPVITNSTGVFEIDVRRGDSSVTLGATSEGTLPMRTRSFSVGDELFEVNGNPEKSIALITLKIIKEIHEDTDVERSLDNGLVLFRLVQSCGMNPCAVANLNAQLRGSTARAFYFKGPTIQEGEVTSTAETSGVSFLGVPPGTYELVLEHPESTCFGLGVDRPTSIEVVVVANTMTNLGSIACPFSSAAF